MRELDCDFCGAPAEGAYEIGPESPDRSPPERRRLVLCGECRETLTHAIQPLLERLNAAESEDTETREQTDPEIVSTTGGDETATAKEAAKRAMTSEQETAETASQEERKERSDEQDPKETEDERQTSERSDDTQQTATDPKRNSSGAESASESSDPLSGLGKETTNSTGAKHQTGRETGSETRNESRKDGSRKDGSGKNESEKNERADSGSSASRSEEPPEFRRVMRLLNNRTFPVDRAEFTDLATGAYGLDEREVDQIVEYAVERGVLKIDGGQLLKG